MIVGCAGGFFSGNLRVLTKRRGEKTIYGWCWCAVMPKSVYIGGSHFLTIFDCMGSNISAAEYLSDSIDAFNYSSPIPSVLAIVTSSESLFDHSD